jgi:mono/diheme cytochrome c family protein
MDDGDPSDRGLSQGFARGSARTGDRATVTSGRGVGAAIYAHACIACNEANRGGAPRKYPPLPGNANLQSADPASTLRIIPNGALTVPKPRAPNTGSMPGYANQLSDQEIADVTNYIRNSWGNVVPLGNPAQVKKARRR